jgi:hypothetical protein
MMTSINSIVILCEILLKICSCNLCCAAQFPFKIQFFLCLRDESLFRFSCSLSGLGFTVSFCYC